MIIGVSGQAGSGKDTIADFLVEDFAFCKVALADPMKRFCKEVFNFSDKQLWGPSQFRNEEDKRYERPCQGENKIQYLTPRYSLQQLGSDWGRDCYNDVWIDYAIRTAKRLVEAGMNEEMGVTYSAQTGIDNGEWSLDELKPCSYKGVVISDCRFRNELSAIKKAGGINIRVIRHDAGLKGEAATHCSETEMSEISDEIFDVVILNNGTLEDLREKVAKFIEL